MNQTAKRCLTLCILSVGCSGSADHPSTQSNVPAPSTVETVKSKAHEDLWLDGKQYTYRGPALQVAPPAGRLPGDTEELTQEPTEQKHRSYLDMSDEELAEALRPVVAWNDAEYILARPDLEMARNIKAAVANGTISHTESGNPSKLPIARPEQIGASLNGYIYGNDDRGHTDNLAYPGSTITHLWANDQNCSATVVGPHTFVTAAHCLVNANASPNQWYSWPNVAPGRDTSDAVPEPFGTWGSYLRSVPQQYFNSGSDWFWDFGIIVTIGIWEDPRPGDWTGWMGIIAQDTPDPIWNQWLWTQGYPGDKPFGTPWGNGRCCDQSNSIWYDNKRIFYNLDAWEGQSGSSVYTWVGDWPYVRIVHKGTWTMFATWNTGRLVDSGIFYYWAGLTPDF